MLKMRTLGEFMIRCLAEGHNHYALKDGFLAFANAW